MTTDGASVAARSGAMALDLEVVEVSEPTPSLRRVRLSGAGLEEMNPRPGQDVMLAVDGSTRRRYSVRAYDATAPYLELDLVLHGDGPAARWAARVAPGTRIEVIGPRGKVLVDPQAECHLFAGDETFIPAAFSMAGSLPAGTRAILVLEVEQPEDRQELVSAASIDGPHWLYRSGGEQGSAELLVAALAGIELPSDQRHAYLSGELRVVAAMRSALLERGWDVGSISPKPYWRKGLTNQDHGEPQRD